MRGNRARKEIAKLFKPQNDLVKLFEKPVAELAEHHFTEPEPIVCKWCGSTDIMKYGTRNGVQEYICLKCKRKFNTKDAPYKMRTAVEQIGASLNMYYDGLSLGDISRHLDETYHNPVSRSTVYRWVVKYTVAATEFFKPFKPRISNVWVVDETVLKVAGDNLWFWDVIDEDTRFLLASYLSRNRTIADVSNVMREAWEKSDKAPKFILSDGMKAYPDGIERVFGADAKHIQAKGITHEINTNLIERFHGTLKARTKVMRGFKSVDTAYLILDGFLIHYNYFRPHMTLQNKTPAEVAGIKAPAKNWTELVRKTGMIV
jgi:putative transposase